MIKDSVTQSIAAAAQQVLSEEKPSLFTTAETDKLINLASSSTSALSQISSARFIKDLSASLNKLEALRIRLNKATDKVDADSRVPMASARTITDLTDDAMFETMNVRQFAEDLLDVTKETEDYLKKLTTLLDRKLSL